MWKQLRTICHCKVKNKYTSMHKYGAYKVHRNAKRRLSPLDYRTGRKTVPVKDEAEIGALHP